MRRLGLSVLLCMGLILAVAGCGGGDDSSSSSSSVASGTTAAESTDDAPGPTVVVPEGPPPKKLVVKDLKVGHGKGAKAGDVVTVQYVGINWKGQPYSNSWTYPEPPSFDVGSEELIRGFDRGIRGMKAGGRRELLVPTRLTNVPNVRVSPRAIPLVFIVDMLDVR